MLSPSLSFFAILLRQGYEGTGYEGTSFGGQAELIDPQHAGWGLNKTTESPPTTGVGKKDTPPTTGVGAI